MKTEFNSYSPYFGIINLLTSFLPNFLVKLIDKVHSFSIKNIFFKKKEVVPNGQNPCAKIPSAYDLINRGQAYAAELYLLLKQNPEFIGENGHLITSLPNLSHDEEKAKLQRAQELWDKNETKNHIFLRGLKNHELFKIFENHPYLLENGKFVDGIPTEELEKKYEQEKLHIEADFARATRIWNIEIYLKKEGLHRTPDPELQSLLTKNPGFISNGKLIREIPEKVFQDKRAEIKIKMEKTLEEARELLKKEAPMTLTNFKDLKREDITFPIHFLFNNNEYMTAAWIADRKK